MLSNLLNQFYGNRPMLERTDDDELRTQCTIEYLVDNGLSEDMISYIIDKYGNTEKSMTYKNLPEFPIYLYRNKGINIDDDTEILGNREWKQFNGYCWVPPPSRRTKVPTINEVNAMIDNNMNIYNKEQGYLIPYNFVDRGSYYTHSELNIRQDEVIVSGNKTVNEINYREPRLSYTFNDFILYVCRNSESDYEELYTMYQYSTFNRLLSGSRSDIGEPIDILLYAVDEFLYDNNVIHNLFNLGDYIYRGKEHHRRCNVNMQMVGADKYSWRNELCHTWTSVE